MKKDGAFAIDGRKNEPGSLRDQKKASMISKKSGHHICPIPLIKSRKDLSAFTYLMNFGKTIDIATYAWYIEGAERKILVDTGATVDLFRARFGPEEYVETVQPIEEGLRRFGLTPEDIDIVILTHLHWDHVGLGFKFRKAKFVVQKAELDYANNPHPMISHIYVKDTFKDLDFELVEGDLEIIEGVKVLFTPGHAPGGQSVAVNTEGGLVIIPGSCSVVDNFNVPTALREQGHEVITPGIHLDAPQVYDSALKVKIMADIILPLHDISFMHKDRIP